MLASLSLYFLLLLLKDPLLPSAFRAATILPRLRLERAQDIDSIHTIPHKARCVRWPSKRPELGEGCGGACVWQTVRVTLVLSKAADHGLQSVPSQDEAGAETSQAGL